MFGVTPCAWHARVGHSTRSRAGHSPRLIMISYHFLHAMRQSCSTHLPQRVPCPPPPFPHTHPPTLPHTPLRSPDAYSRLEEPKSPTKVGPPSPPRSPVTRPTPAASWPCRRNTAAVSARARGHAHVDVVGICRWRCAPRSPACFAHAQLASPPPLSPPAAAAVAPIRPPRSFRHPEMLPSTHFPMRYPAPAQPVFPCDTPPPLPPPPAHTGRC